MCVTVLTLIISYLCSIIVYEAFEQWKRLVHLFCYSEEALARHPYLYHDLISLLHFQLKEIPDDFFVDIVSRDNFLTKTLQVSLHVYNIPVHSTCTVVHRHKHYQEHINKHTNSFFFVFLWAPEGYILHTGIQ